MKKKSIIYALVTGGMLLCVSAVSAQRTAYVTAREVFLREVGDSLEVSLRLTAGKGEVGKMQSVTVTPLLRGSDGESRPFPSFVLQGKSRRKLAVRQFMLDGRPAPKMLNEYFYKGGFLFESWMEEAQLVLDVRQTGCANCPVGATKVHIPCVVELIPKVPYTMRPLANFIMPDAEPIKNRAQMGTARIEFLSGKSAILPTYKKNGAELDSINTAIRRVLGDSLAQVQSVVLTAYSSPEGSYVSNERLSKARAEALKTYIETNNDLKGITVTPQSVAEDWETLRGMIVASDYPWKDAALKIIDGTDIFDGREKKLMMLSGGQPYRMMLKEWFPLLRRTDYRLNYSVKDFTVDQGRDIIKTRPGQMSLNEMFHVANSYEKGSAEFNEVFDIAVRLFPDDPVANINAAAAAITRGDATSALKYLDKVRSDARTANNLGAFYMLTGDLDRAKECLGKAEQSQEAAHNLDEVKLKEDNNALLEKYKKR